MKLLPQWLAAASISLLAPFSYADSSGDVFESSKMKAPDLTGFYGGVSAGIYQADCFFADDNCKSGAWKLYGGYDITEKISLELAYHHLGMIQDLEVSGTGASGIVTLPVGKNGFSALGKVGAVKLNAKGNTQTIVGTQVVSTEVKKSATGLLIGAGTEYEIDDNWKIRTEYEHIGGDYSLGLLSIGVGYSSL